MIKNELSLWHSISKWIIFPLIFLLPIFFSPYLPNLFVLHKQTLIFSLALLSLVFWIIGSYSVGKIYVPNYHLIFYVSLMIIFIIGIISLILAPSLNFALFRDIGGGVDSVLNIFAGLIIFILIVSQFKNKKDVKFSVIFLLCSIFLLLLFAVLNNFFNLFLHKPFLKFIDNSFTPAGAIADFLSFISAGFILLLAIIFNFKNSVKTVSLILD